MKKLIMRICGLVGAVMFFINCSERKPVAYNSLVHEYGNILDIAYTPTVKSDLEIQRRLSKSNGPQNPFIHCSFSGRVNPIQEP